MKKLFNPVWFSFICIFFILISCEQPQQVSEEEFSDNVSEIKVEMQHASELLDDAIEAEHSRMMIAKSNEALNIIEAQLDAYMDEMDRAARRMHKDTRTGIIDMKQKIAEIDFRLSLLESNEQLRISEEREGYYDFPDVRRTRPVVYRFPHYVDIDQKIIRQRVQYGKEVLEEARTNLQELKDELNQFIEENL